jgi:hypothetical protein
MSGLPGGLRAGGRRCAGCDAQMSIGDFEHRAQGIVQVELCLDCRAIWFDAFESAQLAPASILALFRIVQAARERPARAIASTPHCPACRAALEVTHDIQHTTRFTYWRCGQGHGRFTPFVQFLREKEFVRGLTPAEVSRLSATIRQVRCTSCGAAVDIAHDAACPYCGAPLAILDADAVARTLERLQQSATAPPRTAPDAARILEALAGTGRRRAESGTGMLSAPAPAGGLVDLVADVLDFVIPGDFP